MLLAGLPSLALLLQRTEEPRATAEGGYQVTTPVYRATVASDGRLTSLRVGEAEWLRAPGVRVLAGGQVAALTPVMARGSDVTAGEGANSLTYTFEESGIRVRARWAGTGAAVLALSPAPEPRRALRHDDGAPAGPEKLWTWLRWVAPGAGTLTLSPGPRYSLAPVPDETVELPVPASGTLETRLDLQPRPGPLERVECLVIAHDLDHVFSANEPPRFAVRVSSANPDPLRVVVRSEVKSYAGQPVERVSESLQVESTQARTVPVKHEDLKPGFYDLAVTIATPDGAERRTELTFGVRPDAIRSSPYRERDFAVFWQRTLAELKAIPIDVSVRPDRGRSTPRVNVYKVSYASLGTPPRRVHGWFCAPATPGRHAALLVLPGYGDGPIAPSVALAERGYAALAIQVREHEVEGGDYRPARYMTEGIESPESYAYRFIYAHCVRGIDFLASREEVDPRRIGVTGGSQGGALSVVTAALDRRVRVATPDVAFLCDFPVAVEVAEGPYREITEYLKAHPERRAETFRVLSYFDVLNHAPNVRGPIVFSASLRDRVCPPPTIVAVFNQVPGRRWPREIHFLPFTGHTTTPAYATHRSEFLATALRPDIVDAAKPN
jgi:cephalosporin-C deacetylase-like acetyl esterase